MKKKRTHEEIKIPDITPLEHVLGYVFKDKNLLIAALTHPSYRNDKGLDYDNQRLEFLGDSILGFLFAETVFDKFKSVGEGILTVLRSTLASGANLAKKAEFIGAGAYLLLSRGEKLNGGNTRKSNLADVMEALLAAVYLDGGMNSVRMVFHRLFDADIDSLESDIWRGNPKGLLQHISETVMKSHAVYQVLEEPPTDSVNSGLFLVRASVENTGFEGFGRGRNKQDASVAAAAELIRSLPAEILEKA